jgi:DNA-binding response OmpR family regulator
MTRTVLVVDESPTFRTMLRRALEAAGYDVTTASSGEEGVRLAAAVGPRAIVVGSAMSGSDGGDIIRRIRMDTALREAPCILLTGSGEPEAELRALDAGADAFVRKEDDFHVVLARLATLLREREGDRATGSTLGPKRILAVDDSPTYLEALGALLRAEGHDVVLAASGEEALTVLGAQRVDCILLDVVMPGMDGRETCKRIKSSPSTRDTPLILLTAFDRRETVLEGLQAGADDFILKSSEVEIIRARIVAQLRRKQIEDERRKIREDLLRSELVAAEERAARQVAEARAALVDELERKNEELETFTYSVSHDLRAPLRAIDGYGQMLLEDCADRLDDESLKRIGVMTSAAQRMGRLIDALLALSRLGQAALRRADVDVSELARAVADELRRGAPDRTTSFAIAEGLRANADPSLLRVLLDNLMGNAWKFTANVADAYVEVGARGSPGEPVTFHVRDNGAGFDMRYASKLFRPFERLHSEAEFAGTGIGLATAHRIVDRHGGRMWAEGAVGRGASFYFTLPKPRGGRGPSDG